MRWGMLFLLCVASSALAGTTDDAISDARYVEYGATFSTYTVKVQGRVVDGWPVLASGVAIADHWVLTAAHVANGMTICTAGGKPVNLVAIHPEWNDDNLGWHDIALLRTTEPLRIGFYPALSTGREQPGDTVLMAGYGVTGRLSRGYLKGGMSDGKLRAGTGRVAHFERAVLVLKPRRGLTALPFCIAPGDSGGPTFLATGELVGINSYTSADRGPLASREGEESGHTRVSLYLDWIAAVRDLTPSPHSGE